MGIVQWHVHRVTRIYCFSVKLEFGNVHFFGGRKTREHEENPWNKYENRQQNSTHKIKEVLGKKP